MFGLELISSIANTAKDSVKVVVKKGVDIAANNYIGQAFITKPLIQSYIDKSFQDLTQYKEMAESSKLIQNNENLKHLFKQFSKMCDEIIQDFKSDEFLVPLSQIVGNHIHEYNTMEEFKDILDKSKSVDGIKKSFSKLFDFENYKKICQVVLDIEGFDKLSNEGKDSLLSFLGENNIVDNIIQENANADLNKITKNLSKSVNKLSEELSFAPEEKTQISSIFDKLTIKYIDKLNELRTQLLTELKPVLQDENVRLSALCSSNNVKSLTKQFNKKRKPALNKNGKNSNKSKRKKSNTTVNSKKPKKK